MGNVVEYENDALVRLYKLYMEIVAWATGFGLAFPVMFLFSNGENIPQAIRLGIFAFILIVSSCFLCISAREGLFPWILHKKQIRWILYGWGLALLFWVAWLVYCTGGIQSSIFVWLFTYAVIVTVLVRPKHEQTFRKRWRPVLFTIGLEILIIIVLALFGGRSIQIPDTMDKSMPFWGGLSATFSLIASFFSFYASEKIILKVKS